MPKIPNHTLEFEPRICSEAESFDRQLLESRLNPHRQFVLIKSTRNYWVSLILFFNPPSPDHAEILRYVVNEDPFLMLSTPDLAVDHLFYEFDKQP